MGMSGTVDMDDVQVVVSDQIRVLVTGGNGLERDALATALNEHDGLTVVGNLERDHALRATATRSPHVAVILYEDSSDLKLCRRLSTRRPRIGVVMADSFRDVRDFMECREAGAQGFVHHESPVGVLAEAVRSVAVDREFHDPRIPEEQPDPYGLTDRELEVLACIQPGCNNRDIAQQLHITEDTVKYHLKSIYGKFQVHSREELLVIALEEGLLKHRKPRRVT